MYFYEGVPCIKASINGRDCTYTFRVKEFDAQAIEEDFNKLRQAVELKAWIAAQKTADSFRVRAKQGCGIYTSPEYVKR